MATDPNQTLDLESGTEKASAGDVSVPPLDQSPIISTEPYNSVKATDEARKWIGYTLLGLLFVIVLLAYWILHNIEGQAQLFTNNVIDAIKSKDDADRLASVLGIVATEAKADGERLSAVLNIVFGPIVTLLGSLPAFILALSLEIPPEQPQPNSDRRFKRLQVPISSHRLPLIPAPC
jgi:hypothetical protein